MKADFPEQPGPPTPGHTNLNLNLKPFLTDGPDVLGPMGMPEIKGVKLQKLHLRAHNNLHQITTSQADDSSAANNSLQAGPTPKGVDATGATLAFDIACCPKTQIVELRLPNKVKLQVAKCASTILAWLAKSPLGNSPHLLNLFLISLLAIAFAIAPAFDDYDGDEDDEACEPDRLRCTTSVPPSCHHPLRGPVRRIGLGEGGPPQPLHRPGAKYRSYPVLFIP